jgi:hypothetical protein
MSTVISGLTGFDKEGWEEILIGDIDYCYIFSHEVAIVVLHANITLLIDNHNITTMPSALHAI